MCVFSGHLSDEGGHTWAALIGTRAIDYRVEGVEGYLRLLRHQEGERGGARAENEVAVCGEHPA